MQWSISKNRARRWTAATSVAIAAALVISGCSNAAEPEVSEEPTTGEQSIEQLVEAAKQEGQLVVYGSPSQVALEAATQAFSDKYGISVETVRIVGSELISRFAAEKEAKAATADAIVQNMSTFYKKAIEEELVTPLADLEIPGYPWDLPEEFLRPDDGTAVVMLQVRGITYNTDLVDAKDVPKDWKDVADKKWAGRIGIADPASAPVYIGHWWTIADKIGGGEDFLAAVGELNPKVYASGAPATAAVGAGEIAIMPVNIGSLTFEAQRQGAPIEFVIPKGTTADEQALQVNATAAHPNAAKLFVHFMMTEGSQVMAKAGNEFSPLEPESLPDQLWSWPIELADQRKADVVRLLTGN